MARQITTETTADAVIFRAEGLEDIIVRPADYPTDIQHRLTLHGAKQKVADAAALDKGATIEEKFAAMREMRDQLFTAWNAKGGAPGGPLYLAEALAEVCGLSIEDARATVNVWDKAKQKQMALDPEIAEAITAIKARRPAPKPTMDTKAELDAIKAIKVHGMRQKIGEAFNEGA